MSVGTVLDSIVLDAQFHTRHILQAQHTAVGQGLDDHILVVAFLLVAASVLQHILEGILGIGTQGSRRCLDVLFC